MTVTNYVWDVESDAYLAETDETHQTTRAYTCEPAHFGRVVSQHESGESHWLHYDALGSTRQVTDATETVVGTNLYDAWGVNRESTGTVETPFRWVGEWGYYCDPSVDAILVRERTYRPPNGRWTSMDRIGLVDGVNRLQYGDNNPVLLLDPTGLATLKFDPNVPSKKHPWKKAPLPAGIIGLTTTFFSPKCECVCRLRLEFPEPEWQTPWLPAVTWIYRPSCSATLKTGIRLDVKAIARLRDKGLTQYSVKGTFNHERRHVLCARQHAKIAFQLLEAVDKKEFSSRKACLAATKEAVKESEKKYDTLEQLDLDHEAKCSPEEGKQYDS